MDEPTDPKYWTKQISEKGIDAIEGIMTNRRYSPDTEIDSAREEAISSYRKTNSSNTVITLQYIAGYLMIGVLLLYSTRSCV